MPSLPTGTVTFLFTDIEGSTRLLQQLGDRYAEVLATHHRLLRTAIHDAHGHEMDSQGDALFAAFPRAKDTLLAAIAAQRAVQAHPWPDGITLRVRMGLHTGEPLGGETGYVGMDVHRAARICSAGHGGQILLSQTTRDLVENDMPAGVSLRDLGEHRLKDLAHLHRLFQVVAADLPTDFPSLKTLDAVPNNLPIQLTSFVGREQEIAEVTRLLATTGLLTLTGAGGCGKTRLALRVVANLVNQYRDGVWLAELGALSDPALVPKTVATALDIPEQPGRALAETLRDHLRTKSVLLVLDNCEHLLSACAGLANVLLSACAHVHILATSREPLGLPGEIIWRVPSLSVPNPTQLPPIEHLMQFEAVHLFADRAALSQPGFRVTSANAAVVAQLTYRLEGIPLAIELAAARVKALPMDAIAERLGDRFRLLTGTSRTGLTRHQTLRATLDWSYDLLSEQEQMLFRRLSVFAGGFTLQAVEKLCGGEGVDESTSVDVLTRLVDKSLVIFDERDGQARYRLLESVREYGRDSLQESGESGGVRRRHRDWYLALAEQADRELRGPRQAQWLERLETEHDNLRAALEWSKVETDGAEAELRLAGALYWYWYLRGHWGEARGWLDEALNRSNEVPPLTITKALRAATNLAFWQGDYARAISFGEKGLALCRQLNDRENGAQILIWLARVAVSQGHYKQAAALFEESLNLSHGLEQRWISGIALADWGMTAYHQGDYERAAALHLQAREVAREAGDKALIAAIACYLGMDTLRQGCYRRAAEYYRESLNISTEMGHKWWVTAECLDGLAGVNYEQQHYEKTACLYGAAEMIRKTLGIRLPVDQTYHDKCILSTRAALGQTNFAAAWAEGRAMTLEQAVEYALKSDS